ncbi:MAG: cation transporter, partial [Acidimicrobiia bacterium]|nr:cation transporter [Acidimicrobiia bacterium]
VAALAANAALFVVQLVAALAFGSLALLADTAHLATDVVALGLALVALVLSSRPASARTTYGWERAEVLAALVNAVLLVAASGWIIWEAIHRFGSPHTIDGAGVAIIGGVGLVVNAYSAFAISRVSGANLNLRGAFLHLASDAIGSFGVIAAGVIVAITDTTWIDPAISLAITALVVIATVSLLRDATSVLLERAPRDVDTVAIEQAICAEPDVEAVHHLHVWSLGSERAALSAHVVLLGDPSLHDAQVVGNRIHAMVNEQFGIGHATIELECHDCDDAVHHTEPPTGTHHD